MVEIESIISGFSTSSTSAQPIVKQKKPSAQTVMRYRSIDSVNHITDGHNENISALQLQCHCMNQ